jgi:tRNA modification GTPase
LVGRPNAGKSSLLNALAAGTGALVSDQPGTTRDYLTAELNLDGLRCTLVDTAGVEPIPSDAEGAQDPAAGPRRAAERLSSRQTELAHVEILCLDSTRAANPWERARLAARSAQRLLVATKIDLGRPVDLPPGAIETSSVTGEGIDTLRVRLREAVLTAAAADSEMVAGTAVRCRESLRLAAECLDRARRLVQDALGEELVAAELRVALDELGKVVGAVYTDDVLERIFSRFCIGK